MLQSAQGGRRLCQPQTHLLGGDSRGGALPGLTGRGVQVEAVQASRRRRGRRVVETRAIEVPCPNGMHPG